MTFKKFLSKACKGDRLIKKIKLLGERGYILRVPGGSSRAGDHSAFGCIYRTNEELEIEILLVPYNPQIIIPREYEEDKFKEEPIGTLTLKVSEQTGLKIYEPKEIGHQSAHDRRFPANKKRRHIKYVFVIDKYEDAGIKVTPTTDGRIEVPFWLTLSKAHKVICHQHRWIINLAEDYLSKDFNLTPP